VSKIKNYLSQVDRYVSKIIVKLTKFSNAQIVVLFLSVENSTVSHTCVLPKEKKIQTLSSSIVHAKYSKNKLDEKKIIHM